MADVGSGFYSIVPHLDTSLSTNPALTSARDARPGDPVELELISMQ